MDDDAGESGESTVKPTPSGDVCGKFEKKQLLSYNEEKPTGRPMLLSSHNMTGIVRKP
jgi:hypothetical protein